MWVFHSDSRCRGQALVVFEYCALDSAVDAKSEQRQQGHILCESRRSSSYPCVKIDLPLCYSKSREA